MSKKLGVHFGSNYNGSVKAKLCLSRIFFTASTHVESSVLLSKLKLKRLKHINVKLEMDELDLTARRAKPSMRKSRIMF